MKYLTFDPATRAITGAYWQEPQAEHAHRIEVTDEEYAGWTSLRMTADLAGTEHYTPAAAPPVVPQEVRSDQAQLALLDAGLLDNVESAIESIPDPDLRRRAQISWTKAPMIRRHSETTAMLAEMVGLTNAQVDALFIAAQAY